MDIIDEVTYRWDESQEPEIVRQAFCNVFDASSADARTVAKFLVGICRWEDEMDYNDPIVNAKFESLRGVIRAIKKQLNISPIELGEEEQ